MRFPYQKLLIVGNGGAGKSTFARYLSERFSLPAVHLDKLWWLSGWVNRSQEEFDELLEFELAKQKWIIEGNFRRTFLKRLQACDGAIMLDIPPEMFTPAFATARIVGWAAHRIEELVNKGKIIRPNYKCVSKKTAYTSIGKRK